MASLTELSATSLPWRECCFAWALKQSSLSSSYREQLLLLRESFMGSIERRVEKIAASP